MTFEHDREQMIGDLVKFKKLLNDFNTTLLKKIDEQIIDIDRANDKSDLLKIVYNLIELKKDMELENIKEIKKIFLD